MIAGFYRRRPGVTWLVGLVAVPLLLGVIGYGTLDRSQLQNHGEPSPTGALPTLIEPAPRASAPSLAPLSVARQGNEIVLQGNLPDPAAKRTLLDLILASVGDGGGVNVIDNLGVSPGVAALDFTAAGPVFEAAAAIPDFTLAVDGDTVTLAGTAASEHDENAVSEAAVEAWPNVNIVNKLGISGPVG